MNSAKAIREDEVVVCGYSFDDPESLLNVSELCDVNGSRIIEFV